MTQGTDVSEVTAAAAGIQIDGPQKDAMEQTLSDQTGLDVTITGPGGTRGAAAIDRVIAPRLSQVEPEPQIATEDEDFTVDPDAPDPDEVKVPEENPFARNASTPELLFDADAYLGVPTMDGQGTDALEIAFAGKIKYDATDETGRALFEALTLGKQVELRVAGVVAKKAGAWKLAGVDTEKEREVVTGVVGLKVESLWMLAPEDL